MPPPVSAESALEASLPVHVERVDELAAVWRPFWMSRVLVLVAGCAAVLLLGAPSGRWVLDPEGTASSLGHVGNVLAASAVRWDAVNYLQIAQHGYRFASDAGFYPLYPVLVRAGSILTGSLVIAGVLISLASMFAAMVIVRRLTELELGRRAAGTAVWLLAFGPMAMLLSAVYTEPLFIALSAGTFYAARRGKWAAAGGLGCLAAMERGGGVLLLAPVLILFFYGPRIDASPRPRGVWWRPRYDFEPRVLWSALIPLGGAAVAGYMALRGFGPTGSLHAQEQYQNHHLGFPLLVAWNGIVAAWHQLRFLLHGGFAAVPEANQALFQLSALIFTSVVLVGVFRRLPIAYGVYCVLGLLVLHLSLPTHDDPLVGFARYASLRFPLFMVMGAWASERGWSRTLVFVSAALLIAFTVQFSTWHVIGSLAL